MKNLNITLLGLVVTGSFLYGGGTFVEPIYETEDITIAEEAVVEEYPEIVEEYIPETIEEEYIPEVIEEVQEVAIIEERSLPLPPPLPVKDIQTNGLYAGIGISSARFKTKCQNVGTTVCSRSGSDKATGLMARVGYDVNKYVGVEARGIRTNWKANGGKVKHVGVFVKPMVPVGDSANVYGLVGVAKTTTQGNLQRVSSKNFAWGAGVEYDVSGDQAKEGRYSREFDGHGDQEKGLGVFADYERLIQKSGSPDLDTVNVGVTYDF